MKRLYAVLLITALTLFSAVASGIAVFYLLVYALVGVILGSLLWSVVNLAGVRILAHRQPGLAKVGHFAEAELHINNRSPFPKVLLEIQDMAALPGQVTGTMLNLRPRQSVRWLARAPLRKRGVYQLGPAQAFTSDPFGLFHLNRTFPGVAEVTVYPATVDLHSFHFSPGDMFHQGVRYQHSQESAPSVSNIRDYTPGDTFQRMHWPSTAHMGRLMVKQFESEIRNHVWLILDLQRDVQAGGEIDNTEECIITIAASLAEKFFSTEWPVGLMAHGDQKYLLTPQQSPAFHEKLLRLLAVARATGTQPLIEMLKQGRTYFSASSRVVIITPSVDPGWIQATRGLGVQISRLSVVLLDADSFGGRRSSKEAQAMLQQSGIITYAVQQGEPLDTALDYRRAFTYHPASTALPRGS